MDNKLIQVVIAITVGIVVLGSLLVPVITEASTTEKTFTNNGYYNLVKIDDTTSTTMVWDASDGDHVSVDGVDIDIPTTGRLTLLGSDAICVRINSASQIQVYGSYNGSQDYKAISSGTATFTIASGVVTVNDGTTKNFDLGNDAYLIAPANVESDYVAVMKISNENAYLLSDSEIICCGITVSNQYKQSIGIFGKGTVEDMEFSTFYVGTDYSGDTTIGTVTTHAETLSNYVNLYSLDKFTFTLSYNEGSTSDVTFSYFIVPSKVIAEYSQHLDTTEIGLLAVIPVLMIVAFLVFAVRIFGGNRD